jgi:hypothetical protein
VPSPAVVMLAEMPSETLALVTTVPQDAPEPGPLGKASAVALFAALLALHRRGVAHHDLRLANLVMPRATPPARGSARLTPPSPAPACWPSVLTWSSC